MRTYDFAAVYHAIHNFCTIDLSSFYLDFAKDIYTLKVRTMKIVVQFKTVLYDVLVCIDETCNTNLTAYS